MDKPERKKMDKAERKAAKEKKELTRKEKGKSVDFMRPQELIKAIAEKAKVTNPQVKAVLETLIQLMAAELKAGKRVKIKGLGVVKIKEKAAKVDAAEGAAAEGAGTVKRVQFSFDKDFKLLSGFEA